MSASTPTLHDRIRREIEGRIMSGAWAPGHRIPFEHQLMTEYGCSRMTVNKALSPLAERGLIERRRRAGSFVAVPRGHRATLDIPDVHEDILVRGMTYRLELLTRRERQATASDGLEGAAAVLAIDCVHYADGRAFALETRLINLDAVPAARTIDFGREPAGTWLLGHVAWSDARHRVTAVSANFEVARHLDLARGAACLSLERWTWRGDAGITYVRLLHPGDRYDLAAHFAGEAAGDGTLMRDRLNPVPSTIV